MRRENLRKATNQSWMVALRSINEHTLGWYRTCSLTLDKRKAELTVAGAALVFHQTSHLTLAFQTSVERNLRQETKCSANFRDKGELSQIK